MSGRFLAATLLFLFSVAEAGAQHLCEINIANASNLTVQTTSGSLQAQSVLLRSTPGSVWNWTAVPSGSGQAAPIVVENTSVNVTGQGFQAGDSDLSGFVALEFCIHFGNRLLFPARMPITSMIFTTQGVELTAQGGNVFYETFKQPGITEVQISRSNPSQVITVAEMSVPGSIFFDDFESEDLSFWSSSSP